MLRLVVLLRTDVSEELGASIIMVTIFGELGTTLAITSNRSPLRSSQILVSMITETTHSSEAPVVTRRHIPEDGILHSHRRKNLNFT
jgi:hypothetical protein